MTLRKTQIQQTGSESDNRLPGGSALRAQRCVCTAAAPTLINQEGDKVSVLLSTFTSWLLEGTCVLTF